jgi:SAM-dependent methyltransferase
MIEEPKPLESIVGELLKDNRNIVILEAGCGSLSHFNHAKIENAHLVGIDISPEQLEKNSYLHESILGDIQDPQALAPLSYDLIICWDVLEHLPEPTLALRNFVQAAKYGGVILLASPNVLTVRGLITKFTPHLLHVWFYRYVAGYKEAGSPGSWPFKSYHRFAMSPHSIVIFAKESGLSVELERYTTWESHEYKYPLFRFLWPLFEKAISALSFGKIGTDEKMGFQIILRRDKSTIKDTAH